ncbi:MAG TPA: electron transfer flavoprotein subunit beta [Spirochaetia bacterium]|nr:electron transfer flavoprotein subunit beta [Spirochaetia bacterium]
MNLKIVVLVKQVPDTQNITGNAMKDDGTVNRAALPAVFNPEDMHALEAALSLKENHPGSTVHVITMGPPAAVQVLKDSLYRGADSVALVSDRRFAGADTLATSYALKCAIENKIGKYDLVFCGRQAIDGHTAQVGPQTAEKLGINQISFVSAIEKIEKNKITACRLTENGLETVTAELPVLLTVTDENFSPRPPSAKLMMACKEAVLSSVEGSYDESYIDTEKMPGRLLQIEQWNVESIKADPAQCGLSGSPTKVKHIESVVLKSSQIKMTENTDQAVLQMVKELAADHTLE